MKNFETLKKNQNVRAVFYARLVQNLHAFFLDLALYEFNRDGNGDGFKWCQMEKQMSGVI